MISRAIERVISVSGQAICAFYATLGYLILLIPAIAIPYAVVRIMLALGPVAWAITVAFVLISVFLAWFEGDDSLGGLWSDWWRYGRRPGWPGTRS